MDDAAVLYALRKLRHTNARRLLSTIKLLAPPRLSSDDALLAILHQLGWDNETRTEFARPLASLRHLVEEFYQIHAGTDIMPLPITDPGYPTLLRSIDDPPLVLYVKGDASILNTDRAIAIVGTRQPTRTGLQVAFRIARYFAEAGCAIVSGLAKGIDTAAHRGALEVQGRTVAVLGTPLDVIYPAENRPLAEQIVDEGGALVSELPLGSSSSRSAFVLRDRIQSGLSLAVVPIQSDLEGGTMHTVEFAEKQHRLLFCPRPVSRESRSKQYRGIWSLIRSGRAQAFEAKDYQRILEILRTCKEETGNGPRLRQDHLQTRVTRPDQLILPGMRSDDASEKPPGA
jgi:DNA processing protein